MWFGSFEHIKKSDRISRYSTKGVQKNDTTNEGLKTKYSRKSQKSLNNMTILKLFLFLFKIHLYY